MSSAYARPHDEYFTEDVDGIVHDFLDSCDPDIEFPYDLELSEGEFSLKPASHYASHYVTIEDMQERAGETCGDVAEGWLDNLSKAEVADFYAHIDRWASRCGRQPKFYLIEKTSTVFVTVLNEDGDWHWKEEK